VELFVLLVAVVVVVVVALVEIAHDIALVGVVVCFPFEFVSDLGKCPLVLEIAVCLAI